MRLPFLLCFLLSALHVHSANQMYNTSYIPPQGYTSYGQRSLSIIHAFELVQALTCNQYLGRQCVDGKSVVDQIDPQHPRDGYRLCEIDIYNATYPVICPPTYDSCINFSQNERACCRDNLFMYRGYGSCYDLENQLQKLTRETAIKNGSIVPRVDACPSGLDYKYRNNGVPTVYDFSTIPRASNNFTTDGPTCCPAEMDAVAYSTSNGPNDITEQWRLCVPPFVRTSNASLPPTKSSDVDSLKYDGTPSTILLVAVAAIMTLFF